jgi:nucleoid-associated protein YgaU
MTDDAPEDQNTAPDPAAEAAAASPAAPAADAAPAAPAAQEPAAAPASDPVEEEAPAVSVTKPGVHQFKRGMPAGASHDQHSRHKR